MNVPLPATRRGPLGVAVAWFLWGSSLAAAFAAEPRGLDGRVAVQPPTARIHKWFPAQKEVERNLALAAHFAEKLPLCPTIRLVSEERARPFFERLDARVSGPQPVATEDGEPGDDGPDGAAADEAPQPTTIVPYPALDDGTRDASGWFAVAADLLPLRAVVLFPQLDGQASVRVLWPDRVVDLPEKPGEPLFERIRRAADFLADVFALPEEERRILTEIEFPDEEAMVFYAITTRYSAAMPSNPGQIRLAYLRPMLAAHPRHVRLAEEVMRSLGLQLQARRTQHATPVIVSMAGLCLPSLLGTRFEPEAEAAVRSRPADFAPRLIEILGHDPAATELGSMLDDILEDGPGSDPLTAAVGGVGAAESALDAARAGWGERFSCAMFGPLRPLSWRWAEITPEQRLGALRLLGLCDPRQALPKLRAAAADADPAVREAAALGLLHLPGAEARGLRERLATDPNATVARAAMLGQWKHDGLAPAGLMPALRAAPAGFYRRFPDALEAFASLAEPQDRARLRALASSAAPPQLISLMTARFRLEDMGDADVVDVLLMEPPEVTLAALRAMSTERLSDVTRPRVRELAADTDDSIAAAAFELIRAELATTPGTDRHAGDALSLHYGSPYQRLRLIGGIAVRGDHAADPDLLAAATTNQLAVVRFKALEAIARQCPQRLADVLPRLLVDADPWVRMRAAAVAVDHPQPALAAALRARLDREESGSIRPAVAAALAAAEGTAPPAVPPAAHAHDPARPRVWTGWTMPDVGYDYPPLEGFLTYRQGACPAASAAGLPVYIRTLWGGLPSPESMLYDPASFEELWGKLDGAYAGELLSIVDGFDLRLLHAGHSWDRGWRDFCLDAGIDPERVAGDADQLTVHERRAFDHWGRERWISGFNLMSDLIRLKTRFTKPGLRVLTWMPGGLMESDVSSSLSRWNNEVFRNIPGWASRGDATLRMGMACRTLWPDRTFVYAAPEPGGAFSGDIFWDSPPPESFIFETANDVYGHVLRAWSLGADLQIGTHWRFLRPSTPRDSVDPPGFKLSLPQAGPDPVRLDEAITYAFENAPLHPVTIEKLMDDGAELGVDLGELEGGTAEEDPKARDMKARMRTGIRLQQEHMYDCAQIFASLPRHERQTDALVILPGIGADSDQPLEGVPAIAAREIAGEFALLPGVNLVPDHDLGRYRLIVVHDARLLRDETIRTLTRWLEETPGLLVIHLDLSADPAAQASTATDHSGVLRERWPWHADFTIHPPATDVVSGTAAMQLHAGGRTVEISANRRLSHAECRTGLAEPLALIDGKAVMVRWRAPSCRGVVLFDGVSHPSAPYVERLAAEIDALAAAGIGRRATGRPGAMEVRNGRFHAVVNLGYADTVMPPCRMTGIDLLSGTVDPVVGPGTPSAIVALEDHFHRYLACTRDLVALGEREFSRAEAVKDGMLLHNDGVIRIAGRTPPRVTRVDGKPLPQVPFSYGWVLDGGTEGVTTHETPAGGLLTFVRCGTAVNVRR